MIAIDAAEEMPEGWLLVPIPDVCLINPPKPARDALTPETPVTFVPMPAVNADSGTIATATARPFAEVRKGFTAFRDRDVIMAKITPCMENGKAAIARNLENGYGFGSTEFHVFRSTPAILPEFVFYFIRQESFRRNAADEMTGSVGQKRVPAEFLKRTEIPLPPLAEQKRIVAKVETLLARVNAARQRLAKVPTLLKRFRQSVLAAACSGRLTEDWRDKNECEPAAILIERMNKERFSIWCEAAEAKAKSERRVLRGDSWQSRYQQPIHLETDEQSDLPESWQWAPFDTFAGSFQYGPRFGENEYTVDGVPTIRTSDMGYRGNIRLDNPPRVKVPDSSKAHFLLRPDDLLITRTGATIGKCALYDASLGPAIASAYLIRYRLARKTMNPQYLLSFLMSPRGQSSLVGGVTAVAQPNVNTTTIGQIPVPVPPIAEQHEIVRRVDALLARADRIEQRLATATRRVETLTQAILAQAFRGELVPTEAELARQEGRDYEPASVLLERIRTARIAVAPVAKKSPRTPKKS